MATKQEKAQKYFEQYKKNRDDTTEWREYRDRCKKAYFGNQWDSRVSTRIRDRGQVDVVMNIQRTLIRNRVSTMIANKPQGKILGVKKGDQVEGQLIQEFMDWHWYNSNGQLRAERVVMGQQREGVAYFIVYDDPKADYGRGELKIGDLSYSNVYFPKTTREWDFSDSPIVQVSKLITEDDFYLKKRGYKGKITPDYFMADDTIRWAGRKEHKEEDELDLPEGLTEVNFIREIDSYERFFRDMRILYYVPTQTANVIDDDYSLNDNENELMKEGLIKELTAPVPRVRYTKTYGEKIFDYTDVLPIEHYPVIPVPDEDTGNAMSIGEIDQTFGVQELANKAWSLVVHNAALSSNMRMVIDAARAGVKDMDKFRENWAPPGAVVDMTMDPQSGKFPYQIERPEPLNQAFYTLFERLAQHIQFGMATLQTKLGDTSNAPNTYAATLQYREWQQDNLRIPLSRLEIGIQRVFDVLLQWAPEYYTFYKMFDVMSENESPEQRSINEPQFDRAGEAIGVLNDISKVRAKFRIRMGSTMPSQSIAYMNLYEKLAAVNPIFLKYMIQYLPVKEKEQLEKELDLVGKLNQQNEELQAQLNTISGMLQNALRQQTESEIRRDAEKAQVEIDKVLAELDIIKKEMKSEQKMMKKSSENIRRQQK